MRPTRLLSLSFVASCICATALAQQESLPPRSQWRASSSSVETPAIASALAIDGNVTTRWGGGFASGDWLQVDLGRSATLGGVLIRWDSGFARAYYIQSSMDGQQWRNVFEAADAQGDIEYVLFPAAVQTRYLRLASVPRTADWGVSVFEFEPLGVQDTPRIAGVAGGNAAALWSSGPARVMSAPGASAATRELRIELPRPLPVAGLEVTWGAARSSARLEARGASGQWQTLAEDPESSGETSYLAAREAQTVSELRMTVRRAGGEAPALRQMKLLSPTRVMTPLKRYEIAASRAHRELFPDALHRQQVYWTVVGVAAARHKSTFDEYGNVEAFKGAPLVQPIWRDSTGRAVAAPGAIRTHSLREGWMPMPAVEWSPQPGLQLRSDAIAIEQAGAPVTLVRYRLRNTGTNRVQGQLSLVVRPLQVNPAWQHGGVSPIRDIAIEGSADKTAVRVNGRVLLHSLTPVDARGASGFGVHGEDEITRYAAAGTVPQDIVAHDADGLAAALLNYRVQLDAGAQRDVVIALPLDTERLELDATTFDALSEQVAQQWQARLGRFGLSLPDQSLVDMLRAQAAYMLINQTGPAMQPGPRNYDRSFIRDGSATAAVLVRVGLAQTARDYLRWYADHAVHADGLVSPILNDDGTVNRGFGSDLEYDSQGQFIYLVAEIARLDGGAASVREYLPKVRLAMKFMQELRERTLVPGYMADREAPARFRGLIAPSISHEGYSTPTHSYWDDYWALKGWHDGAWLAEAWGEKALAAWARAQYSALQASVAASIRATMAWKHSDTIPAAADLGDSDPTSVSIALDPCGQQEVLPADALQRTFARYLEQVRQRDAPDSLYAYTPYEMRNVLTYVHLNQPRQANDVLMNFMRHRRPAQWQVLAEVVHSRLRHDIYLGDMPHTWVGAEYVRAIFGMLMHEGDGGLHLLPGAPPEWVSGAGLRVSELPTAYGKLSMSAQQQGTTLRVALEPGLRKDAKLQVAWPTRVRPARVTIDGKARSDYTADGIRVERPFRELVAQW